MSKNSSIIGLGILLVVIALFSGFPPAAKDIIVTILGLVIAMIAYFSNVQYCSNCKKIIENGRHANTPHEKTTMGGEISKKNISGIST